MVKRPIINPVDYYRRHLGYLDDRGYSYEESMLVLVVRDDLEDQWDDLTTEERTLVESLDSILVSKHHIVDEVLPTQTQHNRRRWWWYLHEGPQVKDEAERLAASSRI